jgi:broad specificity phosphatase PhoE
VTSRLHLVRHARVGEEAVDGRDNPSLSDTGRRQAHALARSLPVNVDYLASSPLRRALETAGPIATATGLDVDVVPGIGEVVPNGLDADQRRQLLLELMGGRWEEQTDWLKEWRRSVLDTLSKLAQWGQDVLVVTHFVAINIAAGAARADDRVTVFRPPNTSLSTFTLSGDRLEVVELGSVHHLAGLV